ncbi:MAG: TIGR02281 family clan AA aspartic protease [Rubripirellula sp.]
MSSFRLCVPLRYVQIVAFSLSLTPAVLTAQDAGSTKKFSAAVVEKAEKVLAEVQLRQSGKSIQSTGTSELSRAISGLSKTKRELRLVHQDWKQVADRVAQIQNALQQLKGQYGELNLQLARVTAGDTTTNNRIVGLINATNAKMELLVGQRESLKTERAKKRSTLDKAESAYAETVLAIRSDYTVLRDRLAKSVADKQVQIALRVMRANFETPEGLTADKILSALDKRIERIEEEIFSESIEMEVDSGSLYVDVVVGKNTMRMVVDSGATLVTLPLKAATELGVSVPVDARQMKLVLADGRTIPARGVILKKVRVGGFEAENVEAAVLDAVASDAEPLLGMSFLGNFKFEINSAERTLKLLRVEAK